MIEVEMKARIKDPDALKTGLIHLGFQRVQTMYEYDSYYNGNDRNFMKTDEALRIRSYKMKNGSLKKSLLTYKGPKMGDLSQTRREIETEIAGPSELQSILEVLGYSPILMVEKKREQYQFGEVSAYLDNVKGLGEYLELEILISDELQYENTVNDLYMWLDKLHIVREQLTRKSYVELLLNLSA